jgi:hypothetical protein
VRTRPALAATAVAAALFFAASPASAQFAAFSRCHAAFPCSQPFHLEYRPDPLLGGPWAETDSAVSAHIARKANPKVELDKPAGPPADDPVEASVRYFLRRHPALKPKASVPPPETPAEPKKD